MSGLKIVFGGAGINPERALGDIDTLKRAFDVLEKNGVKNIDTANVYGQSEAILSQVDAASRFTLDTKTRGGFNPEGGGAKELVLKEAANSKEKLGSVDIFYIHAPDPKTPLDETLSAINEAYKTGFFKRFGLSNYKAEDVRKVYDHCKEKGYILPTVYQGNYSAVARKQETLLFPTLRKLGMSFYAYSPLAGGFLSKSKTEIEQGAGRFAADSMYHKLYARKAYLDALDQWASIAKEEGITRASLAYRWVRFNSPLKQEHGDALIIGASSVEQLEETLSSINGGPLSEKALKSIDELWETISHEAPLDNYHY